MIENLTKKYGQVTVGIHGQDLPKFSSDETTKEWWKYNQTFNEQPNWMSALELRENQKIWAKNDELRLADIKHDEAPVDPFKNSFNKK